MPKQKTKSVKVRIMYKILDVSENLWIYFKLHIGEDLQRVCKRWQAILKEIGCQQEQRIEMIQFQHAVFLSRFPYNSQDELHDFSIKVEELENDGVLHIRDKEKNVRNKTLKSSYQQPLPHKMIIYSLNCLQY